VTEAPLRRLGDGRGRRGWGALLALDELDLGYRVITVTAGPAQTTQAGTSLSPSGRAHVGETRVPSSG
jgi:hypothetical protein